VTPLGKREDDRRFSHLTACRRKTFVSDVLFRYLVPVQLQSASTTLQSLSILTLLAVHVMVAPGNIVAAPSSQAAFPRTSLAEQTLPSNKVNFPLIFCADALAFTSGPAFAFASGAGFSFTSAAAAILDADPITKDNKIAAQAPAIFFSMLIFFSSVYWMTGQMWL
jgi:hypothetical protein